jgi:hypothetical protein
MFDTWKESVWSPPDRLTGPTSLRASPLNVTYSSVKVPVAPTGSNLVTMASRHRSALVTVTFGSTLNIVVALSPL